MKKLLTILLSCICVAASAQTQFTRSSTVVTPMDPHLRAGLSFGLPIYYSDTSDYSGLDSLYTMIGVVGEGIYVRDSTPGGHKWVRMLLTADQYWQLQGGNLSPVSGGYFVGVGGTPAFQFDVQNGSGGRMYFDGTRLGLYDNVTRNGIYIGQLSGATYASPDQYNVAVGFSSGRFADGSFNTTVGSNTLQFAVGDYNTAVGYQALFLTDSSENSGFGYTAGIANYGKQNTSLGARSGNYLALGSGTIANTEISIGTSAMTGANTSTFISAQSLTNGVKYSFLLEFNGTPPEPYNSAGVTDVYINGTVSSGNTITFVGSTFTSQGTSNTTITVYNKQDNAIAIGYDARTDSSNMIVIGNTNNTLLKAGQYGVFDLVTSPSTGDVLTWNGTRYAPAAGGSSSLTFTSPLVNTAGVVSINNAAADGSTKGAASFTPSDFNASGGNVSLDYPNMQVVTGAVKGVVTPTLYNTWNAKADPITGGASTITTFDLTASRALVSSSVGKVQVSSVTSTELGYVSGVTSAIQTQINNKLSTTLNSAQIFVGDVSNVAIGRTMSGAATLSTAGVLTLALSGATAGTYTNPNVTITDKGIITAISNGATDSTGGTVLSVTGTLPIISDGDLVNPDISIRLALADGGTTGAASFSANDFNDNGSGNISLDYTNGLAGSAVDKGYIIPADWTNFNNKVGTTRTISTTSPLAGGGDFSTNRTFTVGGLSSMGTANYIVGVNAGATGWEYKQFIAGSNITITPGVGSVTIAASGGSGSVTNVSGVNTNGFSWSIANASTTPAITLSLQDALADGSTKGKATFTAADFNASSGSISLDYPNMQIVTGSVNGIVTPTLYNSWQAKAEVATGAITTVYNTNLTGSRALVSTVGGKIDVSSVTSTELGYLSGVTSNLAFLILQYTTQTLTDGATITMNCNNGFIGEVTLGGNRTLAFSNFPSKGTIQIKVKQDATGNRTLTLPAGSKVPVGFGSGTTINLSTAANVYDILFVSRDSAGNYNWTIARDFQ